jgi:hypothetical protein
MKHRFLLEIEENWSMFSGKDFEELIPSSYEKCRLGVLYLVPIVFITLGFSFWGWTAILWYRWLMN